MAHKHRQLIEPSVDRPFYFLVINSSIGLKRRPAKFLEKNREEDQKRPRVCSEA